MGCKNIIETGESLNSPDSEEVNSEYFICIQDRFCFRVISEN